MIKLSQAFDLVERGELEPLSRDRIEVPERFNWAREVFEGASVRALRTVRRSYLGRRPGSRAPVDVPPVRRGGESASQPPSRAWG